MATKLRNFVLISLVTLNLFTFFQVQASNQEDYLTLDQIPIRDPNILLWNGTYYLTGTTSVEGFLGYSSVDSTHWSAHGFIYFRNTSNYWAQRQFWAPEMHEREGKFYLFFTAISENHSRATGVAVADHPLGPYVDLTPDPLTPAGLDCLDGHPFTAPNGTIYLYYSREWIQYRVHGVGEMWVQELAPDYTHLIGSPVTLFKGTDAPGGNVVVDGPWMVYAHGRYYLFWSSFDSRYDGKYCIGYAIADSPLGPFKIEPKTTVRSDGGHCTIFRDKNDLLKITYHQPNAGPERTRIKDLRWNTFKEHWEVIPQEPIAPAQWNGFVIAGAIIGLVCVINILCKPGLKIKKNR
jgi:beta-xylosidase